MPLLSCDLDVLSSRGSLYSLATPPPPRPSSPQSADCTPVLTFGIAALPGTAGKALLATGTDSRARDGPDADLCVLSQRHLRQEDKHGWLRRRGHPVNGRGFEIVTFAQALTESGSFENEGGDPSK